MTEPQADTQPTTPPTPPPDEKLTALKQEVSRAGTQYNYCTILVGNLTSDLNSWEKKLEIAHRQLLAAARKHDDYVRIKTPDVKPMADPTTDLIDKPSEVTQ